MTSCSTPGRPITWRRSSRPAASSGLAWVELSTGRFSLTGLLRTELVDEIARLNPAEILISELSLDAPWVRALRGQSGMAITVRPSWDFQPEQARTTLFEQFGRRRWPASASTTAA